MTMPNKIIIIRHSRAKFLDTSESSFSTSNASHDDDLSLLAEAMEIGLGDVSHHAVIVADHSNSSPSRYADLYKNPGKIADQKRRWRASVEALTSRKQKRQQHVAAARGLPDDDDGDEEEEDVTATTSNKVNHWSSKSGSNKSATANTWRNHSRNLMLAEWFLFMPPDFESDYMMKFCPKGRQVCVHANRNLTKVFSRTGHLICSFASRLPGGGIVPNSGHSRTLLDCVMADNGTQMNINDVGDNPLPPQLFYVLDMMCFRSTGYQHFPFRDRQDWLTLFCQSQIEEYEPGDSAQFIVLPAFSCDADTMQKTLDQKPEFKLDGILFYHTDVNYSIGATPLVGWIKPYMLAEWFPHLTIQQYLMEDRPQDYINYLNEIVQEEVSKSKG